MYKKIIFLIFYLFLFTGCMNYTELNELGIIETMGIEKQDDKFLITLNMIDAKSENDESDELRKYYQATGKNIADAFQNIYLKTSKQIYISHLETLIISEDILNKEIEMVIDFFLRNEESRNAFLIVLSKDTLPSDILLEKEQNMEIRDLIKMNEKEYGITSLITFEDFARNVKEEAIDPVIPVIKLDDETIEVDGYAYLKKKKTAYLTKEESIIFNILQNKNSKANLSISNDNLTAKITAINTKYKIDKNNISFIIDGDIFITENANNLKKDYILKKIKSLINNQINKLVEKSKIDNCDILGLTSLIRKTNNSYYQKEKKNLLKKINIDIQTELTIVENPNQKGQS